MEEDRFGLGPEAYEEGEAVPAVPEELQLDEEDEFESSESFHICKQNFESYRERHIRMPQLSTFVLLGLSGAFRRGLVL